MRSLICVGLSLALCGCGAVIDEIVARTDSEQSAETAPSLQEANEELESALADLDEAMKALNVPQQVEDVEAAVAEAQQAALKEQEELFRKAEEEAKADIEREMQAAAEREQARQERLQADKRRRAHIQRLGQLVQAMKRFSPADYDRYTKLVKQLDTGGILAPEEERWKDGLVDIAEKSLAAELDEEFQPLTEEERRILKDINMEYWGEDSGHLLYQRLANQSEKDREGALTLIANKGDELGLSPQERVYFGLDANRAYGYGGGHQLLSFVRACNAVCRRDRRVHMKKEIALALTSGQSYFLKPKFDELVELGLDLDKAIEHCERSIEVLQERIDKLSREMDEAPNTVRKNTPRVQRLRTKIARLSEKAKESAAGQKDMAELAELEKSVRRAQAMSHTYPRKIEQAKHILELFTNELKMLQQARAESKTYIDPLYPEDSDYTSLWPPSFEGEDLEEADLTGFDPNYSLSPGVVPDPK
jgi:prefoldin subunit 5